MRGFWRARQKSVGCISPHAWKLPLVMAVCILVYSLPLSLAVSVEPLTGPGKFNIYRSLTKNGPLTKECPPPTFGPISCIGSKFTRMSAHPGVSLQASHGV